MRNTVLTIILAQILIFNDAFSMDVSDILPSSAVTLDLTPKSFEEIERRFHTGQKQEVVNQMIQFFENGNLYSVPYLKQLLDLVEKPELKSLITSCINTRHSDRNFERMSNLHNPKISNRNKITTYKKTDSGTLEEVLSHYGNTKKQMEMATKLLQENNYKDAIFWYEIIENSLKRKLIEGVDFGIFYWNLYTAYKKIQSPKAKKTLYISAQHEHGSALREFARTLLDDQETFLKDPLLKSSPTLKIDIPHFVALAKIQHPDTVEQFQEGIRELAQAPNNGSFCFTAAEYFLDKGDIEKVIYFINMARENLPSLEPIQKLNLTIYMQSERFGLKRNDDFIFNILDSIKDKLPDNHKLNLFLGLVHTQGFGTPISYEKAYRYYSRSLNAKGFCDGKSYDENAIMGNLASLYRQGKGVGLDQDRANALMDKAIENGGHVFILFNRALTYYQGRESENDIPKAIQMALPLALEDHPTAQTFLGVLYKELGDTEKSLRWFRFAEQQGDLKARYNLIMHSIGMPNSQFPDFISSLRQNMEDGDPASRLTLGFILSFGHEELDIKTNFVEARKILLPLRKDLRYQQQANQIIQIIESTQKKKKKERRIPQPCPLENIDDVQEQTQERAQNLTTKQIEALLVFSKKRSPMKKEEFNRFLKIMMDYGRLIETKSGSALLTEMGNIGWHRPHKHGNTISNATTAQVREISTKIVK